MGTATTLPGLSQPRQSGSFTGSGRVKLPVERSSGYSLVQEREPTLAVGTFPEYRQMAGGIDGRLVMGIIYSRCQLLMTTIVLLVRMPVGV
jgi:hypothetical protein